MKALSFRQQRQRCRSCILQDMWTLDFSAGAKLREVVLPAVLQPLHDAEELLNRAAQSEEAVPGTFPPPFYAEGADALSLGYILVSRVWASCDRGCPRLIMCPVPADNEDAVLQSCQGAAHTLRCCCQRIPQRWECGRMATCSGTSASQGTPSAGRQAVPR